MYLKHKGKKQREETCDKHSDNKKLYWINLSNDERNLLCNNISKSLKGKITSDIAKEKLSKYNATLTKEQVIEIVALSKEKTYKELALIYGINASSLSAIVNKKSYKWVWT